MKIREITLYEVTQVSGGWAGNMDSFAGGLQAIESIAKMWNSSADWRYVAATHPALSAGLKGFFDGFGLDGKRNLENWATTYAPK